MILARELIGSAAGLLGAMSWGGADFLGGLLSRRVSVAEVIIFSQGVAAAMSAAMAVAFGEPLPSPSALFWGALSGVPLTQGLLTYYCALSSGKMSIISPVAGILSSLIAVAFSVLLFGPPGTVKSIGVVIALLGIGLVSLKKDVEFSSRSLKLTSWAGIAFGGFYVTFGQIKEEVVLWPLLFSRLTLMAIVIILVRGSITRRIDGPHAIRYSVLGALDLGGTALFGYSYKLVGLDVAAILTSFYPLVTILLSRLILNERLSRLQSGGVLMTLVAVPLINGYPRL